MAKKYEYRLYLRVALSGTGKLQYYLMLPITGKEPTKFVICWVNFFGYCMLHLWLSETIL